MPSFNTIMVKGYVALISCAAVVQASVSMTASTFDDCVRLDSPWFNKWFSLALARSVGI